MAPNDRIDRVLRKNDIGLKDWAVNLELLGGGQHIAILKSLPQAPDSTEAVLEHREFFLFPTFEADMTAAALKPEHHAALDQVLDRRLEGMVKFAYYCEARAAVRLASHERLHKIEDEIPYAWSYIEQLSNKSPRGIFLIILRVYKMREALMMVDRPMYDGRHSWVTLEAELPTRNPAPILTDEEFESRVQNIKNLLMT